MGIRGFGENLQDQVKSTAERGVPSERENCSAKAPLEGVYFSIVLMYPSA